MLNITRLTEEEIKEAAVAYVRKKHEVPDDVRLVARCQFGEYGIFADISSGVVHVKPPEIRPRKQTELEWVVQQLCDCRKWFKSPERKALERVLLGLADEIDEIWKKIEKKP